MKKLAVIVPCYNEELVIAESYRRTREALHKLPVLTEIIYINDGSRDRTRLMLDEIAASDPQVKVIHFSRNFGHQPAVTAGINNLSHPFSNCRKRSRRTWFIASASPAKGKGFSRK